MTRRTYDLKVKRIVYGTCVLVVLVCLAMVILILMNHGVPQRDSYAPNPGVPQYGSLVLPACHGPCVLHDESPWRTT
jgi:hypothetical protein